MITPYQRRKLTKVLLFAAFWFTLGCLYVIIEKGLIGDWDIYPSTMNPYDFKTAVLVTPIGSTIMGLGIGFLEVYYLGKYFDNLSFGRKILFKTVLYIVLIIVFLFSISVAHNSIRMGASPFHPEVAQTLKDFFFNFVFWSIVIYIGLCLTIGIFTIEISDNLGLDVFKNFLTGRYHHPREEDRIFMFLDMRSSVTIAEKLGHQRYYELLNQYYADMTEPIINSYGDIYQYVGDEVVVSWDLQQGLANNNCLKCFFDIQQVITRQASWYEDQFGLVPGFKAGLHCGLVTTGEVGVAKKDILFTGDVLNATSRIQESCNEHQVDILISGELLDLLKIGDTLIPQEIGEKQLRGREAPIKLFTIKQTT